MMGGVEDKTRPPQTRRAPSASIIRGVVVMGGVEVKN